MKFKEIMNEVVGEVVEERKEEAKVILKKAYVEWKQADKVAKLAKARYDALLDSEISDHTSI